MTTETDTTNPFANQALLSIAPKIPAALSMVGSYAIIREAVVDLKAPNRLRIPRLSRTLLRTLVALSVADLFYSLPWVLTTQTAPSEIPYLYGNVGNTQTCSAFGAIFQVGFIAEPTFNVLYALFSLLMVRCQWNTLHFNRTEPLAQVSIWLAAFASAIIPIPYNVYNRFVSSRLSFESFQLTAQSSRCKLLFQPVTQAFSMVLRRRPFFT